MRLFNRSLCATFNTASYLRWVDFFPAPITAKETLAAEIVRHPIIYTEVSLFSSLKRVFSLALVYLKKKNCVATSKSSLFRTQLNT